LGESEPLRGCLHVYESTYYSPDGFKYD
jgi:hypothetical protein